MMFPSVIMYLRFSNIVHAFSGDRDRDNETLAGVPAVLAHRSLSLIQNHSNAYMVDLVDFLV